MVPLYYNGRIITFKDNSSILEQVDEPKFVSKFINHTIKGGETLFSISRKYYQKTSRWFEIADMNNLVDVIELIPGNTLIIPIYG